MKLLSNLKASLQTEVDKKVLDLSLLGYRILLASSLFLVHGWPKVQNFQEVLGKLPDPFGFGALTSALLTIFANVVCPIFIALGLFTRAMILPILAVTLTGFFIVHAGDPAKVKDMPFMYSLAFLLLLVLGPGKHALDNRIKCYFSK